MNPEIRLIFAIGVVLVFYLYIFVKNTPKKFLIISAVIFVVTVIIGGNLSIFLFILSAYGVSHIDVLRNSGALVIMIGKPAFGGFFEELFRAMSVVIYTSLAAWWARRMNHFTFNRLNTLDNQIYGLAFIFAAVESVLLVKHFFPEVKNLFRGNSLNLEFFPGLRGFLCASSLYARRNSRHHISVLHTFLFVTTQYIFTGCTQKEHFYLNTLFSRGGEYRYYLGGIKRTGFWNNNSATHRGYRYRICQIFIQNISLPRTAYARHAAL